MRYPLDLADALNLRVDITARFVSRLRHRQQYIHRAFRAQLTNGLHVNWGGIEGKAGVQTGVRVELGEDGMRYKSSGYGIWSNPIIAPFDVC